MIKCILVPASGSSTDEPVFATALAAARALTAHLDFYHVRLPAIPAGATAPPPDAGIGAALPVALQLLSEKTSRLSGAAAAHFRAFCDRHGIAIRDTPERALTVSASFLEESGYALHRLMLHARHCDLVILGRASHIDHLPSSFVEDVLMGCGRPILIAPDYSPETLAGTVVVGWNETAHCARALSAAYPLLEQAQKVILLNLIESGGGIPGSLDHLAQRLRWHGIPVESHSIASAAHTLTFEVGRAAADLRADLLVVGAFGHRRLQEHIFGGVTRSLLEHASMPVLMMH
jgi:nucleotide-binding universal stress UspA family protein